MSWDIFVQDLPIDAQSVDDILDDFVPTALGLRSHIIAQIQQIVPFADFSDPSWGSIDSSNYSIEVNLGNDEIIHSFAFHVRGSDVAAGVITAILQRLHLRAIDG